jgi:hypothetical protein
MTGLESLGGWAMAMDGPFAKLDGTRSIDVGGNLGHFLHKVLVANPKKQGILFDREPVRVNARKLWNETGGVYYDGVEERMTMVSGDFFNVDSIPDAQDGDIYYMRYILHDWPKKEAVEILRNIRTKMRSTKATLLIGEMAIPERSVVGAPWRDGHSGEVSGWRPTRPIPYGYTYDGSIWHRQGTHADYVEGTL